MATESLRDILQRRRKTTTSESQPRVSEPEPEGTCPVCHVVHRCNFCHDAGIVRREVEPGQPGYPAVYPACPQCGGGQGDRAHKLEVYGITPKMQERFTFDKWQVRPDEATAKLEAVRKYALMYADGKAQASWLVMLGSVGWGKTHLACAIAMRWFERGTGFRFITAPDMLDEIKETFGRTADDKGLMYEQVMEYFKTLPLLIVDDLGANSDTAWAQEKFYQILDHRWKEELPTIITSNRKESELDERIRSRMKDTHAGLCVVFSRSVADARGLNFNV